MCVVMCLAGGVALCVCVCVLAHTGEQRQKGRGGFFGGVSLYFFVVGEEVEGRGKRE